MRVLNIALYIGEFLIEFYGTENTYIFVIDKKEIGIVKILTIMPINKANKLMLLK